MATSRTQVLSETLSKLITRSFPRKRTSLDLAYFWKNHGIALLFLCLMSMLLSWPTVAHFTTSITSSNVDAKHNLWLFWHVQRFVTGKEGLFDAPLLYYPYGISLLTHGVGPITGFFALPFWWLGPEAAYNGSLIVSLTLTGYFSYLLARKLGFRRAEALFCGVMLLSAPMCLGGLTNHVTKVFLGAQPLLLIVLHNMLNLKRSQWWAFVTGSMLLIVWLHNGYQFVFSSFAVLFFWLVSTSLAQREERFEYLKRAAIFGLSCAIFVLPMLIQVQITSNNPAINVDASADSRLRPDLLQYLLPVHHSLFFGDWTRSILNPLGNSITINLETAVSLSIAGIVLLLVGLFAAKGPARRWVLFTLICVLISLGPNLQVYGIEEFGEEKSAIMLPYSFINQLPGLDFMRAPGRWMMMGFVAFAVAATFGLAALTQRFPRQRMLILGVASALVLIEVWPKPFPQEVLPKAPPFYQQIAKDTETYGVFDLPIKESKGLSYNGWSYFYTSSIHQVLQITHGKGIVAGYISRTYSRHPLFNEFFNIRSPTIYIDGEEARYKTFQQDLAAQNYRYVVLHKNLFGEGRGEEGYQTAKEFTDRVFGSTAPYFEDEATTVYKVNPDPAGIQLHLGTNWRSAEDDWRWAASPATLLVNAPTAQEVVLEITPAHLHDPNTPNQLGEIGRLNIQVGDFQTSVDVHIDLPTEVRIPLAGGEQTIAISLEAGNFAPEGADLSEIPALSFAVRSINLKTQP